jgi:UDP-N-acetylglucosamine--N-acetylmuramyl-(pentapeptide) pyrophosphoryl-undecaprenol N-acetylglucosamine transferase
LKVIFAGGGTGGHLMAGLSIAQEISSRFPGTRIIFFGTSKKNESGYIGNSGYEFKQIKACKLTSFIRLPFFLFASVIGIIQSLNNIIKIKPDIIVGLGGYGSVLPVVAAFFTGIPIVLIEQNVIPGRANLKMARWVDVILCQWESTTKRFKNVRSISVTGIPIRRGIVENETEINNNPFGFDSRGKTLLVMGGSQGASAINEIILKSIPRLKKLIPDIQVIHLTGKQGYKEAKDTYNNLGINSVVSEYFNDIGAAYRWSDLVVCRAGANTIAEISAVGIPAILIPYPYATDNHQYWNANELERIGGAIVVKQEDLDTERMVELISNLLVNEEKLNNMRKFNRSINTPFAGTRVVDKIYQTLEKKQTKKDFFSTVHSTHIRNVYIF